MINQVAKEVWRDIPRTDGNYRVSSLGRVASIDRENKYFSGGVKKKRRLTGKVLKQHIGTTGYWTVDYREPNGKKVTRKVHRLVAQAFIDNPNNLAVVNHIDGNQLNNQVWNLEWVTQSENLRKAYQTGLRTTGAWLNRHKIVQEYAANERVTIADLCAKYGANRRAVKKLIENSGLKLRTTGDYQNRYKIDRKTMVSMFDNGDSNKTIANFFHSNKQLIAVYRYKYKKGELTC